MSEPRVLYESKDFLVVNKPTGLMTHGVKVGNKRPSSARAVEGGYGTRDGEAKEATLVDWLLKKYPEIAKVGDDPDIRPGIVHRLDKDTSGVMLVARNQKTFEYLKSLFQKHEIKKIYLAVVSGELKEKQGTIDSPIGILTGSTRRSIHSKKMAKEAVTEYKVLRQGVFSLLEVRPRTGRTHQIRVHLASIGHPIVGDKLYGPQKRQRHITLVPSPRLMLHALSIEFVANDGKHMLFEAEPPPEFSGLE